MVQWLACWSYNPSITASIPQILKFFYETTNRSPISMTLAGCSTQHSLSTEADLAGQSLSFFVVLRPSQHY